MDKKVKQQIHTVTELAKRALENEGVNEATVEVDGIKITLTKKIPEKADEEADDHRVSGFHKSE